MTDNELHVLRAVRDDDLALLVGYHEEVEALKAQRLLLLAPSGVVLSDAGRKFLGMIDVT